MGTSPYEPLPGSAPEPAVTRYGGWYGVGVGLGGTMVLHALAVGVCSAFGSDGPLGPLILGFNPGVTILVWGPIGAFLLRKQRLALQGFLFMVGTLFLLNGACWGVICALGASG